MSTAVYWQPVKGKRLGNVTSSFLESVPAREYDEKDIDYLRGVEVAIHEQFKPAVQELISAIYKHGIVRVWRQG